MLMLYMSVLVPPSSLFWYLTSFPSFFFFADALTVSKEAFRKGKEEGRREGREEGREEGRVEGRVEGREEGLAEGRARGKQEGMEEVAAKEKKAWREGLEQGEEKAKKAAKVERDKACDDAYDRGYNTAMNEANAYWRSRLSYYQYQNYPPSQRNYPPDGTYREPYYEHQYYPETVNNHTAPEPTPVNGQQNAAPAIAPPARPDDRSGVFNRLGPNSASSVHLTTGRSGETTVAHVGSTGSHNKSSWYAHTTHHVAGGMHGVREQMSAGTARGKTLLRSMWERGIQEAKSTTSLGL